MMKMTPTPILTHPVCLDGGIKREWKEWRNRRKKENQWMQRFPSKPVKIGQFLMIRLSIKRNPQRLVGWELLISAGLVLITLTFHKGPYEATTLQAMVSPGWMLCYEERDATVSNCLLFHWTFYTSKHQMTSLSFDSQETLETLGSNNVHNSNEKIKITICLIKQNYNLHVHHSFLYISLLFAN